MAKSMQDKLFFASRVGARIYVDFGCADGTLLQFLSDMCGLADCWYIGFDESPEMIRLAQSRWNGSEQAFFSDDWVDVLYKVEEARKEYIDQVETCIIFSSVLHEVFTGFDSNQQRGFWKGVNSWGFNYIVIRDMAQSTILETPLTDVGINGDDLFIRYPELVGDFEKRWGNLATRRNVLHFLLKYRWITNWERELEEDYLSLNPETMINELCADGYTLMYHEAFTLKYLENAVKDSFDIRLCDLGPTHIKSIFKRGNHSV